MTFSENSKLLFFITFTLFFSLKNHAQNNLEDLNVIFKHDFEKNTLGDYRVDEWKADFLNPEFCSRQSELDIVKNSSDNVNNTKVLQINFPANSLGPDEGGTHWWTSLNEKYDELYVSYDLMFMPGFEFQDGGKLPSVKGGNVVANTKPTGYDGFTGGLMFKADGRILFYIYYADNPNDGRLTLTWGSKYALNPVTGSKAEVNYSSGIATNCKPGEWHNITYRMALNTVKSSGGGNYDGIMEAYFDGQLVTQVSKILFRHTSNLGIDIMRVYTFFGGSTDDFRNPIAEWLKVDNFLLYTFKDHIPVARGNTLSPTDRTINYWRMFSTLQNNPPNVPTTLSAGTVTKTSINLKWKDNAANEQGFVIYRSSSLSGTYTEIGKVTANVTSYSDQSLQPGTSYYYRVCAYNAAGTSEYSNVLTARTTALQLPATPTGFSSSVQTKNAITLKWTDNSQNEQGFSIWRSPSVDGKFTEIAKPAANTTSYTNSNLSPATTYYYKIRAFNNDGVSAFTTALTATTKPLEPPAAPSGLIASHIDYESATLVWKDNATNEIGFELIRNFTGETTLVQVDIPSGTTSYTDTTLDMNTSYQYKIRALNEDGTSAWSNIITVVTPRLLPPVPPTKLKSTKFTEKSISVSWKDNSSNEDAFVITRSLATDPASAVHIAISANDTAFTDSSLVSSTTYQYTIKAVNKGGSSPASNKNVATTLSHAELKRVKNGLIAYYNFGFNPDYIVYDQSGYDEPLNLNILDRSAVNWNKDNTLDMLSNTAIVSLAPATKVISAIKETGEITFECWLKPAEPYFPNTSRIATLSASDAELGFAIDQELNERDNSKELTYHVRMQTASTVSSGYPDFTPDITQLYINLQHLVYTRNAQGKEIVYLNGVKSSEGFRPSELSTWNDNYYLRLGNESDMNHSWTGSYYSVALFNRALSADEVLVNYSTGPCDSVEMASVDYSLSITPNPTNKDITVSIIPNNLLDYIPQTTIIIRDVYGKLLIEEKVFNPNTSIQQYFDLGGYLAGIYFVQVISGSKQKTAKVILQK